MSRKVTIRDVAKHAGVSVASVSYVLNDIDKVTAETKDRILKSIAELDYSPSLTARCLSKGDSKLIGVSLPITEKGDIPGVLLENNPFFGEFISGIEYTTRKQGYDILISGMDTNEQYKDWIQRRRLDGIIMLGVYPHSIFEEINKLEIPIVLTDAYEPYAAEFHRVMVEDELGGYLATRHLIDRGHRKIAFVAGSIKNSYTNYYRYEGYKKALREARIKLNKEFILEDHVTFNGGYRTGKRLLDGKMAVTAAFAAADIMAIGIIKSFLENGKLIPRDLSVIGFDDIKLGQYTTPSLTTIKQDIIMKGRVSAEMIMEDLKNNRRTNHSVVLKPELIIRDSTDFII